MTKNSIIVKGMCDKHILRGKSVGDNIKHLRDCHRMTQRILADKTYININRIRKIESDELTPSLDEAKRICEVLQVSVLALFYDVRIGEINCDSKTGLNENTVQWLAKLNRDKHDFIKIINYISDKPKVFDFVYGLIKPMIIKLRKLI